MKRGIIVTAILFTGIANAASFDCTKASVSTERAICASPALSKADETAAVNYRSILASDIGSGARVGIKRDQIAWLKTRNLCGAEVECIMDAIVKRNDEVCGMPVLSGVHPNCDPIESDTVDTPPVTVSPTDQAPAAAPANSVSPLAAPSAIASAADKNPYRGDAAFFGEPCHAVDESSGEARIFKLISVTGFMHARQQQAAILLPLNETAQAVAMAEAFTAECKPGRTSKQAADAAAQKLYKGAAKSRDFLAPALSQLSVTCGTVVNLGASVRPLPQIVFGVIALTSFMSGYAVGFGRTDTVGLAESTKYACVQMQPMRFADVYVENMRSTPAKRQRN